MIVNPRERTFHNQSRQLGYKNTSGESAPAFACLVIGGATTLASGEFGVSITKPVATTDPNRCGANGSVAIANNATGEMSLDVPIVILVSGSTVSAGDAIGPVAGSWAMQLGGQGWQAITGETTRLGSRTVLAIRAQRRAYTGKSTEIITAAIDGASITYGDGDVQIYDDNGASISGFTVNAKNSFTTAIPSGTIVLVDEYRPNKWKVVAANCEGA